MTPLTEDEAWANYDRLVKDGATGQYLDETRAAIRAALVRTPETLAEALDRLAKSGPPEYVEVAALTLRDWLSDEPSAES